ncbi:hypothetical protein CK203_067015 [Vitis vinifera]|uniref:Reverse transcriptase zinc-binding domain-containing protein n=1 Tax=Vitis vinifera TaxID=29760 RepID=A0A438F5N6_VITVI|nr:hypothetical protein CK203_067015 [Vitis vinifera]
MAKRDVVGELMKLVVFWSGGLEGDPEGGNVVPKFPQLYAMAVFRNATVNEVWDSSLVVRVLWEIVLTLFGAQWVFPKTVKEVLPKVSFFAWRLLGEELIDHMLNHCVLASFVCSIWSVLGAALSVRELLSSCMGPSWVGKGRRFRRLLFCVCFGRSGKKGTTECLITKSCLTRD